MSGHHGYQMVELPSSGTCNFKISVAIRIREVAHETSAWVYDGKVFLDAGFHCTADWWI